MGPRTFLRQIRTLWGRLRNIGRVRIASDSRVGMGLRVARRCFLDVGKDVSIGPRCTVMARVTVLGNAMISARVSFIGKDHEVDGDIERIHGQAALPLAIIELQGDNFVGYNSVIVGNITLPKGACVAAGSVLTKSPGVGEIWGGSPARLIRRRSNYADGT